MKEKNLKMNQLTQGPQCPFRNFARVKNPVGLVVFIAAIFVTLLYFLSFTGINRQRNTVALALALFLWAAALFLHITWKRKCKKAGSQCGACKEILAKKLRSASNLEDYKQVPVCSLKKGDLIIVQAGEQIPVDGEVIEGAAFVDESAITGESALVIRESGDDRSFVTGGTVLTTDFLVIRVTDRA